MDMNHGSMDHSSMSGGGMGGMDHSSSSMSMTMTFQNTHDTPLFSKLWTPSSDGSYAGTCIFLIILAVIDRLLFAFRAMMERRWLSAYVNRRYITIAGKTPEAARIERDPDSKDASLVTAQGVEESVKVVQRTTPVIMPWRFSVDLPRALIFLCITGVSYLLMLAVMTMNVGYFCSVLGGAFLGELGVGRFIQYNDHIH